MKANRPAEVPGEGYEMAFVGRVFKGNVDGAGADEAIPWEVVDVKGV